MTTYHPRRIAPGFILVTLTSPEHYTVDAETGAETMWVDADAFVPQKVPYLTDPGECAHCYTACLTCYNDDSGWAADHIVDGPFTGDTPIDDEA